MPNVRLPTGELTFVPDDQVDALLRAAPSATVETSVESDLRMGEARTAAQFDTTGQKALTFVEGLGSGLTFGASDLLTDSEASNLRGRYNSGYRSAGEITGMVAPAILSGGTSLLAKGAGYTAGGLASRAGISAAERMGLTGIRGAAAAGAVEGGVWGLGTATSQALVSNDPVTVEGFVAAVGYGALLGAGANAIGQGMIQGANRAAAKAAVKAQEFAEAAAVKATKALAKEQAPLYRQVVQEVEGIRDAMTTRAGAHLDTLTAQIKGLDNEIAAARQVVSKADPAARGTAINNAAEAYSERASVMARSHGAELTGDKAKDLGITMRDKLTQVKSLVAKGDFEGATAVANEMGSRVQSAHSVVGDIPGLGPIPEHGYQLPDSAALGAEAQAASTKLLGLEDAKAAMAKRADSVTKWTALADKTKLPNTLDDFRVSRPETINRLEQVLGATEEGRKTLAAFEELAKGLGITASDSTKVLSTLHSHLNQMQNAVKAADGVGAAVKRKKGGIFDFLGVDRGIKSGAGRVVDKAVGGGFKGGVARTVASSVIGHVIGGPAGALFAAAEVSGMRAAAVSRVRAAVIKVGPKVGKTIRRSGPVLAAMQARADGTTDKSTDLRELAVKSIDETVRQAQTVADSSFVALQGIMASNPDAAAAMQQQMMKVANYLVSVMPRDPGTVQNQFKSTWKPTTEQAQRFAEAKFAATQPLDAVELILDGHLSMVMADTLRTLWPALHSEMVQEFSLQLPSMGKIPHNQLAAYSAALGVPFDGLHTKENIAYFQGPDVHGRTIMPDPVFPKTPDLAGKPPKPAPAASPSSKTMVQNLQR